MSLRVRSVSDDEAISGFLVKHFNDIRYDFVRGKIRNVPANEDLIIKDSLEGAYEILKKIKDKYFK